MNRIVLPSVCCLLTSATVQFTLAQEDQALTSERYIEEVVVTAEKRTEDLQDISQAVSVFGQEILDREEVNEIVDLDGLVPGVSIVKNEGMKRVITIRGVGNEANQNNIAAPAVAFHMDGIYMPSGHALNTGFLDLQSVEVIRGPQGTLFGQNATGGMVNATSFAPDTAETFGKFKVSLGNFGLQKLQSAINMPISETLATRISASINTRDGFTKNVVNGQQLDDANGHALKLSVLWDVTPRVSVRGVYSYFDEDINGPALKGSRDITSGSRRLAQDSTSKYSLTSEMGYVILSWHQPSFTFKSLTSIQPEKILVFRDNDRHTLNHTRAPLLAPAYVVPSINDATTFTQEFQFISEDEYFERVQWLAGVFYVDTEVFFHFFERIDFGFDGTFDPVSVEQVRNFQFGDYGFISSSDIARNSYSVYFQGTYDVTYSQRAIGGLRYTKDDVTAAVTNFYGRSGTDRLSQKTNRITGRLAYEIDLDDRNMIYGSYTRGFKPGGSNLTFGRENEIAPILVPATFEDEIVDVIEFGWKAILFDERMRLNTALFNYEYNNLQYQATDPEVFEGGVANIPSTTSRGFELESNIYLTDYVSLDLSLALIDSQIQTSHLALDNVDSDLVTNTMLAQGFALFGPEIQRARAEAVKDVKGNQLPKVSPLNGSVRLNFNGSLGAWGSFEATFRLIHRGQFYYRLFNHAETDNIKSFQRVGFFSKIIPNEGRWYCNVNILNLTNVDGINSRFTDVFGVGATSNEYIAPRQVVVGFGYDF